MPRLVSCPQDQGVSYGFLDPIAIVLHRTYGQWPGDYAVIKNNGLAHFLVGQQDGQWVQFVDTNAVTYHCNGANFKAVGIELTGTNDDPLTAWQEARLGDVLQFLHAAHGIPLDYTDPNSVPPASVWVNGGGFRGVISHDSVQTDDGSAQHSDLVTVADYDASVAPAPIPVPTVLGADDMIWIADTKNRFALLTGTQFIEGLPPDTYTKSKLEKLDFLAPAAYDNIKKDLQARFPVK